MIHAKSALPALLALLLAACGGQQAEIERPQRLDGLQGVDVSHFQGTVDWATVQKNGIHFAYLKASEGLHTTDQQFARNWADTKAAGVKPGAYHFFHPNEDAVSQAQHFLNSLKSAGVDYQNALPPVLDVEIADGISRDAVSDGILVWLKAVETALGCKPVIYTGPTFWDQHSDESHTEYELWLADYAATPTVPDGWRRWLFWQHTPKGAVGGIDGDVDLSMFAGSRIELDALSCK